ncbi:MAG: hypothetical protein D4R43_00750 [Sphingobacteriales bacterium]|nr:MAG: hypothetical protein D4R43_00750 [Sphingobacteriales bacterium]
MKIFEPSPIRIYFFVLFQIVVFNSCNGNSVVEREIAFIADTSKIKSLSQEALSFCKKIISTLIFIS